MTWLWVLVVPFAFGLLAWQIIAWIDQLVDQYGERRGR